jgi:hypothetical protein
VAAAAAGTLDDAAGRFGFQVAPLEDPRTIAERVGADGENKGDASVYLDMAAELL